MHIIWMPQVRVQFFWPNVHFEYITICLWLRKSLKLASPPQISEVCCVSKGESSEDINGLILLFIIIYQNLICLYHLPCPYSRYRDKLQPYRYVRRKPFAHLRRRFYHPWLPNREQFAGGPPIGRTVRCLPKDITF